MLKAPAVLYPISSNAKKNIPAQKTEKGQDPRVSPPDENNRRPPRSGAKAHQKTQAPHSLAKLNPVKSSHDIVIYKLEGKGKPVIVISKKIAPLAVDRNRIKRLIKEALRQMEYKNNRLKIIVKKNFSGAKMTQVKDIISALLVSSRT